MSTNNLFFSRRGNVFLKLFVGIFLALIIVFIFLYYLIYHTSPSVQSVYIPEIDLVEGTFLKVTEGSQINLSYSAEEYNFIIYSISSHKFVLKNDLNSEIEYNKTKNFDLDNDGKGDISIEAKFLDRDLINISIMSLSLIDCPENWYCTNWTPCINNFKERKCIDFNLCGTETQKPEFEKFCIGEFNQNTPSSVVNHFENLTDFFDCGFENSTIINECFIQSVDECNKSKLISKINLFYEGFLFNSTNLLAVKSDSNNSCYYYQKNLNSFFEFSEELVEELIAQGYSQKEISDEEKAMNDSAQNFVGLWTQCLFNKEDLKQVFENWKTGNYQGGENCDFVNGELFCQYSGDFKSAIQCGGGI